MYVLLSYRDDGSMKPELQFAKKTDEVIIKGIELGRDGKQVQVFWVSSRKAYQIHDFNKEQTINANRPES